MTQTLDQVLGAQPFFADLSEGHLSTLASVAKPVEFSVGKAVFREGDLADACYLMVEGDVALELNVPGKGPHVLQTLHAGDMLGWSWLVPPFRYVFDAQALTPVKAVRFDAVRLRAARKADPVFGMELLERFTEVLVRRMQAARLQLLDVYGNAH